MEWNRTTLIPGLGATVVRASSTISSIPPRLLHAEKLLAIASHHRTVSGHYPHSKPLARISLHLCPKPFPQQTFSVSYSLHLCPKPFPQQTFSVSYSLPISFVSSSPTPFRCCGPSSSLPPVSLMSSRLAPAYSSFGGLTPCERRGHCGPKCRGPGSVQASVEIRSKLVSSDLCWKDRRARGKVSSSRCMENEKNGQRIDCCSSSSQIPAGGGDQTLSSSSVLPPTLPEVSKVKGLVISFCPRCGAVTEEKIPVGEHEKRYVCTACGSVHYQNPKMVVGCLVEHEGKILLCRRNIEPSFGLWTLPAGYMEMGESAAEGAARETLEEACAQVQVVGLFAHIDIPLIGQSHIYFRAQMKDPHFAPGPESIECALFKLNEIPFDSLAFSSIQVALKMYLEDTEAGKWRVHHAVIDKRPGAGPSDLKGFVVRDVLSS